MRIVAGRWAGTDLMSPGGRVRPTAEAVRDQWLALLDDVLPEARVLELYAGTGAVGLEALSRGAASVDFVENNPATLHALKANIAALRATGSARVFKRDALRFAFILSPRSYDLALADPPYGSRQTDRLVQRWLDVPFATVLAVEHASEHHLPGSARRNRIGEATISVYRSDG